MNTKIVKIDPSAPDLDRQLEEGAFILRSGGLVAFPTETVYGIGANALDRHAVEGIYKAKGRPSDNPLIVHIAEQDALKGIVHAIPSDAPKLMKRFWPGPLTMVMSRSEHVPSIITAGLDTVAVRMPSHPIALALIRQAGIPVAAPSANSSGRPSPTTADHVIEDLYGKVDMIIDGGSTKVGLESTVLDITADPPMILRPGGVTLEELQQALGTVILDPAAAAGHTGSEPPRSPGMKYRHYAPSAPITIFQGNEDKAAAEICSRAAEAQHQGRMVGILATDETLPFYAALIQSGTNLPQQGSAILQSGIFLQALGSRKTPETMAASLFGCLRAFDEHGCDIILAEAPATDGIGMAVMNRLAKAAGGNVIRL